MKISELRKQVKQQFPHVTIKIKTVSFADLARAERKSIKISGDKNLNELQTINNWAEECGVLPDGGIRFYGN